MNKYAANHLLGFVLVRTQVRFLVCEKCRKHFMPDYEFAYCGHCGHYMLPGREARSEEMKAHIEYVAEKYIKQFMTEDERINQNQFVFPNTGIYIMFNGEHYKIGKSEDVRQRFQTFSCAELLIELLHVIETSDLTWCERFLHQRYRAKRIRMDREWFTLDQIDLEWLFNQKVIEPPKTIQSQMALLDLL